jgi:hypothetical protein
MWRLVVECVAPRLLVDGEQVWRPSVHRLTILVKVPGARDAVEDIAVGSSILPVFQREP